MTNSTRVDHQKQSMEVSIQVDWVLMILIIFWWT